MRKRCVGEKHDKNIAGQCFPSNHCVCESLGVGWGLSPAFLISPGDTVAAGLGTTL